MCQQSLCWAQWTRSGTPGNTEIFQRTRDGFNWATDFQVAPKKTRLQRSIILVGPVCDRGNIIVFWSIGGAIVNKGSGHWMEFRACWRRLHAGSPHSSAKKTLGTRGTKMLMGFKQDSAGDDEQELTHLPFRSCCQHCVCEKMQEKTHVRWLDGCWIGYNTRTGTNQNFRNEENGKRICITKKMVTEFGATLRCRGCLEIGQPHTEECRARATTMMEQDPAYGKRLGTECDKER